MNKPVNLMCIITQWDFDAEAFLESDIVIEIELPEGFELVDGTLKWQGHVDPNQTMTHTVTIKAVKTGKWTIRVWGGPSQSPRFELRNLYVKVTETSARISAEPSRKSDGCETYFKNSSLVFEGFPLLNTLVNLVCTVKERDFASDIIIYKTIQSTGDWWLYWQPQLLWKFQYFSFRLSCPIFHFLSF